MATFVTVGGIGNSAKEIKAFMQENTFTFVVGSEQQQFHLHPGIVSNNSKPFGAMMENKHMEESLARRAHLRETDVETFGLFVEFAYTGNYRPASAAHVQAQATVTSQSGSHGTFRNSDMLQTYAWIQNYMRWNGIRGSCRSCTACQYATHAEVMSTSSYFPYCCVTCRNHDDHKTTPADCVLCGADIDKSKAVCEYCAEDVGGARFISKQMVNFPEQKLQVGDSSHEQVQKWLKVTSPHHSNLHSTTPVDLMVTRDRPDFWYGDDEELTAQSPQHLIPADLATDNLGARVRLWICAECYDIPRLQQLSLFKLHRDLCALKLSPTSANTIVGTVKFVYDNTADNKVDEGKVDLRRLLSTFAVCHAHYWVDRVDFLVLVEAGGDLAKDFVKAAARRTS